MCVITLDYLCLIRLFESLILCARYQSVRNETSYRSAFNQCTYLIRSNNKFGKKSLCQKRSQGKMEKENRNECFQLDFIDIAMIIRRNAHDCSCALYVIGFIPISTTDSWIERIRRVIQN